MIACDLKDYLDKLYDAATADEGTGIKLPSEVKGHVEAIIDYIENCG